MVTTEAQAAAHRLLGLTLTENWKVIEKIERDARLTGGTYSACYIVENPKRRRAFLKAIDIQKVMATQLTTTADPAKILADTMARYTVERDLVKECRGKDRVVTGIADGQITIDGILVPYLIFETAQSDIRATITDADQLEDAWKMRILHHTATGLFQLHSSDIVHQDIKPSNVMIFPGEIAKVGDLGRASIRGRFGPVDDQHIAGDKTYAPIEQHYGYIPADWAHRRLGADLYLLGSFAAYIFSGAGLTSQVLVHLHPSHHFNEWRGPYGEVVQNILVAYSYVLNEMKTSFPPLVAEDLYQTLLYLTHPQPEKRGHPQSIAEKAQYSLVRFVEQFNLMASRLERGKSR